jgi:hypothetical protein
VESESIWLKLKRAIEHLEAVKGAIAQDVSTYGNRFTAIADGKETLDLLEPGPVISMLAGELIYQLRSNLDHLAFDLVEMNSSGIALPAGWEEECQFPIRTTLKPGQTVPLPYGTFKNLPGIPVEAHTIIERVQPYYPVGSVNNSLRFLNKLSNIDKHRRFALTRTRAKVRHKILYKSGCSGESLETLDHGEEMPTPYSWGDDPILSVERNITLKVAFDERDALGDATTVPIDDLLETILNEVWKGVIEPLRGLLN